MYIVSPCITTLLMLISLSTCVYGNCLEEDCVFTKWSEWSGCICAICDETGDTKQSCFRTRSLLNHADGCQNECGETFESGCIGQCCNTFCAVTEWNQWSDCRCFDDELIGRRSRNRTGIDGQCSVPCDIIYEESTCDDFCCPIDCHLGQWNDWSACSVECNTEVGYTTRVREMVQGTCGGNVCSLFDSTEVKQCNGVCELSEWSSWNCTCDQCMINSTNIFDHCVRTRMNCSDRCGDLLEEKCTEGNCCDSTCELNIWSEWTECSAPCDSAEIGTQIRSRSVASQCAGHPCQSLEDSRLCNASCCPHHCTVSDWGQWTLCTANCESDNGTQVRTRNLNQGACGGLMCSDEDWRDIRTCQGACRLDSWSDWVCLCSSCNKNDPDNPYRECSRRRDEINPDICRGNCGSLLEYKCEGDCCDELCTVGEWGDWTTCDAACGFSSMGNMTRTRQPSESCSGDPCSSIVEIKECFSPHCCPEDCVIHPWESWLPCSNECSVEEGTRVRYRSFTQGSCNGMLCSEGDRFEIESCQGNCNVSTWSEWSCDCQTCSVINNTVLYNYCTRNRTVSMSSECSTCEENESMCRNFEEECCDETCLADEWSTWSLCTVGCETYSNGTQERTRQLIELCTGRPCFDVYDQRECGSHCCPENCTFGPWEEWAECSSKCSTIIGSQVRFRDINQGSCGGNMCNETDAIDIRTCYGYCEVSSWSEWSCVCSDCSNSNSTLFNDCRRTRSETNDCEGLNSCGSLFESTCSAECCNEMCSLSQWTEWTSCSAECMTDGTGSQYRVRSIDDFCMTDPCEVLFENRTCNAMNCCPVSCTLDEWQNWSTCTSVCSDQEGYRARYRDYNQGSCGGVICTDDHYYEVEACMGNCTLTTWSEWDCMCELCSDEDTKLRNSCIRERSQVVPGSCISEDVCGSLVERGCFEVCCDKSCAVTEWGEWNTCSAPCDTDEFGEQMRHRSPIGICQSDPCHNLTEIRSCLAGCCPIDCFMGEWTEWFTCSSFCQHTTGVQARARNMEQAYCGGLNCTVDDNYEIRPCQGECLLSEWSSWNCSCTICNPNEINFHEECVRERYEIRPEECDGRCGSLLETTCSEEDCCDEFCSLSQWSEWSDCNAACGVNDTGIASRTRQPVAACFSDPCVDVYESKQCMGPECCPVDCNMGEWTQWSLCSSICSSDSGLMHRNREIIQGVCGGELCFDNAGYEIASCYGNCTLSEWTDWTCKCDFCDQDAILKNDCIRQRSEVSPEFCIDDLCGTLIERVCSRECCDEFCILSEWSVWSTCLASCNTSVIATKERSREPIVWCLAPPCNSTEEVSICDDSCCPIDCTLEEWNAWLPCSSACSDIIGTQIRERGMHQGSCGGVICSEDAAYETRVCYGTCHVNDWTDWTCNCTACAMESNNQYQNCSRKRTSILDGYCSDHCSATELKCDDLCCDDSCTVNQWSEWTDCTAQCELNSTALQERFRNSSSTCVGVPCAELYEARTCYSPECCSVNCTVGVWSEWTICSSRCSGEIGVKHRVRDVQNGSCGGTLCNVTDDRIDSESCVGECQVSEWTEWICDCSFCSNSNYSRQNCTRHRNIIDPETCLLSECDLQETKCGEECCDEDCELSEWSVWSNCSKSCDETGSGIMYRERSIINQCNADPCEPIFEENECFPSCCPKDCKIGVWTLWSQCTVLCYFDVGIQSRSRDIWPEVCGGRSCNNSDVYQVKQCSGPCELSEWSEWACECSLCNVTTDLLYNNCSRSRTESDYICNGNCGNIIEHQCVQLCCDPQCNVTNWSLWSSCSLDCGVEGHGEQTRIRSVNGPCRADPCDALFEIKNCSSECCPRDCLIGSWTDWSNCSASCSFAVGTKRRSRTFFQAECGGIECLDMDNKEEIECNGACEISDWNQWSCVCHFCVPGDQYLHNQCTRTRSQSPECTGLEESCGQLEEEICGDECCDDFCFVSDWSEWGECSANCANETNGIQERSRTQISQFCLGPPCEALVINRTCSSTCCPRDCNVLEWSEWSACSASCSFEVGNKRRSRTIVQAECGGIECLDMDNEEEVECNGACELSDWSQWSCTCHFCAPGDQHLHNLCTRTRNVSPQCTGLEESCGQLEEEICGDECCDDFCFVSDWSEWGECSANCANEINGTQERSRTQISQFCLGPPCEALVINRTCSSTRCPRDCTVLEWSEWSACSADCSAIDGTRNRTRGFIQGACGGATCDTDIYEMETCTSLCSLGEWNNWSCSCAFCNPESTSSLYNLCERTREEHGICDGRCGELTEEKCTESCCDDFCATDEWSPWSDCSDGISVRNRNVVSVFCFGDPCGGIQEENVCQENCCVYSEWTTWSNCSTNCAETTGYQSRSRTLESECLQNACTDSDEIQSCVGTCHPSDWSAWECTYMTIVQHFVLKRANQLRKQNAQSNAVMSFVSGPSGHLGRNAN
ncbi:SCO-spondin-like [Antedon mediterranea]|uniref:SCO-spondin-like n=1 Tax=Antedon mediterranea TaxID=105859 RepID=UPI003AF92C2E